MFNIFNKNKNGLDLSAIENPIIRKNCKILSKLGLPVDPNMPSVLNTNITIKSKEEIAKEMIDCFIMAHRSLSLLQGVPPMNDVALLKYVVSYHPSQNVVEFLDKSEEEGLNMLRACSNLYYRVDVYLYFLGIKTRPDQQHLVYVQAIEYDFENLKDYDKLLSKIKMISNDELLEFIDLIDRYEYARKILLQNNQTNNKVNFSAVIEQKAANDFIIGAN